MLPSKAATATVAAVAVAATVDIAAATAVAASAAVVAVVMQQRGIETLLLTVLAADVLLTLLTVALAWVLVCGLMGRGAVGRSRCSSPPAVPLLLPRHRRRAG